MPDEANANPTHSDAAAIQWISQAIGRAIGSARFCVEGRLPDAAPDLEVEGLGPVRLPLERGMAKRLIARCQIAPYGQGTRTLVDTKVRRTFELDPSKFRLGEGWRAAIAEAARTITGPLGLPADSLEAHPYKLLVYEKGGFFLPHRDGEKQDRMVASLVVVLPNAFEGGNLVVRHGAEEARLSFAEAAAGASACYAAFYADCEHEVERVTRGARVALTYNVALKPASAKTARGEPPPASDNALARSIAAWVHARPATPLVFAFEHYYTPRGFSLELLKGADRRLADLVAAAAENADCGAHLARVERHLLQYADDNHHGRGYRYRADSKSPRVLEIGEAYEDKLTGSEWTDVSGKNQPWGAIPFDLSAIVSATPIDDWKPTSEEYQGYTGNEGNTLDRWYHRSAIVVWRRDRQFDVVARAGASACAPLFLSMAAALAKTPKKRLEEARGDCVRCARAIIARWPTRSESREFDETRGTSPLDDFAKHLLSTRDRDTVAAFLAKLAEVDRALPLRSLVLAACREFGWGAFSAELKQLIGSRPKVVWLPPVAFRDIEWLAAFCEADGDADAAALAGELCAIAVERYLEQASPGTHGSSRSRRGGAEGARTLSSLLQALVLTGRDDDLARVIDQARAAPDEFHLDDCQVPVLTTVIAWSHKRLGAVRAPLAAWLEAVREQLQAATAQPPTPPADWTRPAELSCNCVYCAQLSAFLADPAREVGRISASERERDHLAQMIRARKCDVTHKLEKKGRPFTLVLTKTTGSHDRAVQRYHKNLRLLGKLPPPCG